VENVVAKSGKSNAFKYQQIKESEKVFARKHLFEDQKDPENARKRYVRHFTLIKSEYFGK
jgi:hypothetical protein